MKFIRIIRKIQRNKFQPIIFDRFESKIIYILRGHGTIEDEGKDYVQTDFVNECLSEVGQCS